MGEPTGQWLRRVGTLLSIPLTLGLSPVVGCALGWVLDRLLHSRPLFTLIGLGAGFAAGIRETWMLIRRTSSESEEDGHGKEGLDRHR